MIDTTPDYAELIEKLEKVEPDTPGKGVTRYYRNPDGPEAATAFRTLLERNKELERHLGDLLAIIHRDGGHYQAQYGDQKAVDDAHKIWAGLITRAEAAEARVKELEKLCNDTEAQLQDYAQRLAEADRVIERAIQEAVADDYDDWFHAARSYLDKKEKSHD